MKITVKEQRECLTVSELYEILKDYMYMGFGNRIILVENDDYSQIPTDYRTIKNVESDDIDEQCIYLLKNTNQDEIKIQEALFDYDNNDN